MKWESGAGPNVLVAHRCDEHRGCAPVNKQADALAVYVAERQPSLRPLGQGPNHEEIHAECGACIAADVEALYQVNLDLLDLIADTLTSRAQLRAELDRFKKFSL